MHEGTEVLVLMKFVYSYTGRDLNSGTWIPEIVFLILGNLVVGELNPLLPSHNHVIQSTQRCVTIGLT